MKKEYQKPEIELVIFEVEDVLCTSGIPGDDGMPGGEG